MVQEKRFEEEWSRREEELIERMSKIVVDSKKEGSTLPFRKWRNSMDFLPPSLSGGTPAPLKQAALCGINLLMRFPVRRCHGG
ncbi:hypothetical protein ANANG_G00297940 [Anguilla anguilla]|uniref:Uncharacterized protein n=1 Tax=Anguilla anguilla TaxID=7936 RepID=A0A9D3RJP3_ANGAN|nr:hypothetical protein ANANG_G00297940 [Anguilla anguilla]